MKIVDIRWFDKLVCKGNILQLYLIAIYYKIQVM